MTNQNNNNNLAYTDYKITFRGIIIKGASQIHSTHLRYSFVTIFLSFLCYALVFVGSFKKIHKIELVLWLQWKNVDTIYEIQLLSTELCQHAAPVGWEKKLFWSRIIYLLIIQK